MRFRRGLPLTATLSLTATLGLAVTLGLVATMILINPGTVGGQPRAESPEPDRTAADSAALDLFETCAGCHEDEASSFQRGPHSVLDRDGLAAFHGAVSGCTACHGDPTAHLDSGGEAGNIFAFGEGELANVKSAQCLTCHGDSHPGYFASRHAAAGLDCSSCHSMHSNDGVSRSLLKPTADGTGFPALGAHSGALGGASASCAECHTDVLAEFEFNERHRLQEGILDCSSCHDPHASSARWRLAGFKQQQCVDCHADKSGPFVFEHGAQKVEGCVACHQPHGSPNRHMLTFQSTAELCYSCHAGVPGFHTRFTADSGCTNCHSTIHGSNFDAAFLK